MVKVLSKVRIVDNSGGIWAKIIRILGGNSHKSGKIGTSIVVAIKKINRKKENKKVYKGDVIKALILKTKEPLTRKDGIKLKFERNLIAVVNKQGSPLGSRIKTTMAREIRTKNNAKLFSIGKKLVI